MFRRKKKPVVDNDLQIPNLDLLETWVLKLIAKLELVKGEYTILPAYGGVLIYIRNQGITWVTYSEIKSIEGQIDKNKLIESGALIGGFAIVKATGGLAIPFLVLPSLIKVWYRSWAKPSPKKTMTFLQSMISEIVVEATKLNTKLLNTFEDNPLKNNVSEKKFNRLKNEGFITYSIYIKKKYLVAKNDNLPIVRYLRRISSAFTGNEIPIFAVHPQADIDLFLDALEKNGIKINKVESKNELTLDIPDDGIVVS